MKAIPFLHQSFGSVLPYKEWSRTDFRSYKESDRSGEAGAAGYGHRHSADLRGGFQRQGKACAAGNGIKIERGIDALSGLRTTSISVDAAGVVVKYAADYTQLPPASSNTLNAIYLVGKLLTDPDYIDGDIYDEYITIQTSDGHGNPVYLWEKIGSMDIDLSNYVPTTRKINDKPLSNDIELTLDDIKDGHEIRFSDFAKADEVQNIIGPHSELEVYSLDAVSITGKFEGSTAYLTQAPTEDNPEVGSFKVVILNYEPAQRYNGYIYLITADDF